MEWRNGEASTGNGVTIYADASRQSLSEAIEASERLLALVDGNLLSQVQNILRVQKKLWKQL
jgi:hypothetical protein